MRFHGLLTAAACLGIALQVATPAEAGWGREHGGSADRDRGGWHGGDGGGWRGGERESWRGGGWGGGWRGGFGWRSGWNGYGWGYRPGWGGWGGAYGPVVYGGYSAQAYAYAPVEVAAPIVVEAPAYASPRVFHRSHHYVHHSCACNCGR